MVPDTYVDAVLRKADTLCKVGFWHRPPYVHPRAWLENFAADERETAAAILDGLIYFSTPQTNALLRATYRDLRDLLRVGPAMGELDRAVVTGVEGEAPNPSDSGNVFCRKARQVLGIDERRVVEPAVALDGAIKNSTPVLFLDDFMGSANQLKATWQRPYRSASPRSFEEAYAIRPFPAYYLVLITTKHGLERAAYDCPGLVVCPGHVLGDEYSVRRLPELPHVPQRPDLADRLHKLLEKYAHRLKLQPFMRQSDFALYGFHSFGLTLAFEHGCPDASIPLIWAPPAAGMTWTPLVTAA